MAASARRYKSQLRSGKVAKHFLPSTTVHPQVLHGECFVNLRSRVLNHGHGLVGQSHAHALQDVYAWAFSGLSLGFADRKPFLLL